MDRMEENRRTFRSQKLITKNDVLSGIQELKEECRKQDDSKGGRVSEYTKRRIREIERFEKEIKRKVIFDAPEDWWAYSIEMRSSDISLFLEHYKILFPAKGTPVMDVKNDERYCLLTMKAKLLTVEEYAKMHKIEDCIGCRSCASKCPYQLDTPNLLKYMLKDYDEFYASHKDLV